MLYNQQLDYLIQKSTPLFLVLCHFNPVHTSTVCFSRLHFRPINENVHFMIALWNGIREGPDSILCRDTGYFGVGGGGVRGFSPSHQDLSGV
jgi:hypothetical protein